MIRKASAVLMLAVFGALLLPLQQRLDAEQKAAHLRKGTLSLELRERVGQMGFLAALSGFRSPLAAVLWIEAHNAWEKTEWGRMAGLFETVTTLQPRSLPYWDLASWHMAYNAAVAAREDKKQPSEALRIRNERQYVKLGRDILETGIRNNPDSAYLHQQLGVILRDKIGDHCAAASEFLASSQLEGAPPYVARAAGYEMAKCPGREREAYRFLKALYDKGEVERKPTLLTTLRDLEKKLDVPEAERIPSATQ